MTVTVDQRTAGLELANQIRRSRAELKRELTNGERALAEVLRADEPFIQTMRIADLLQAVPAIGPTKAQRALAANRLGPSSIVKAVSTTRREQLIAYCSERYRRAPIDPDIEAEMFGGKGGYR